METKGFLRNRNCVSRLDMTLLAWTLIVLHPLWCDAASILIELTPANGKISIGDQASVQCNLPNADSRMSLFWYRCQGNICYKLGTDGLLTGNIGNDRYKLEQVQISNYAKSYKLTVTDAKLEDSATFECRLSRNLSTEAEASKSIVVCAETSSSFCDCMSSRGWAAPDCFQNVLDHSLIQSAKNMKNSVVGLIIAFVVMVAATLVIFLIGKRESLHECCQEEQTDDKRTLHGTSTSDSSDCGQVDPSDSMSDSAGTCSISDPCISGRSDSQGSIPGGNSSTQRLYVNQMTDGEPGWKLSQLSRHKVETSFVTKPEVHYNIGYSEDEQQMASGYHGNNNQTAQININSNNPVSFDDNIHYRAPLSGQGAVGQQLFCSNYNQPQISMISGSDVFESNMALGRSQSHMASNNPYDSSMLNLKSQSRLDMSGTEI